jgi:hypothetical protein
MKIKYCKNKNGYGKLRSIKYNGAVADKLLNEMNLIEQLIDQFIN